MTAHALSTRRRVLLAVAVCIWTAPLLADVPMVQVGRGPAPEIDGALDEATWKAAAQLLPFLKIDREGLADTRTRALACYDDNSLYVGFHCDEPAIQRLVAHNKTRDSALWHDDCVEVLVDLPDGSGYAHVIVNTLGVTYEAKNHERSWNPKIRAAVQKAEGSWSAELAIPWKALGGRPKAGETWRMNFCRERKAQEELSSWSPARGRFLAPATFGRVTFVDKAIRMESFDPGAQLPGANRATLQLTAPGDAPIEVRVQGAKPVRIESGAVKPIEVVYALGLSGKDLVFSAYRGDRPLWKAVIPTRIEPAPRLGALQELIEGVGGLIASLPKDHALAGSLREAVGEAEEVATEFREAVDASLRAGKPLDMKRYRSMNQRAAAKVTRLSMLRWPVWTKNNWADLARDELPDGVEDLAQLEVRSLVNEYESANVIVSNLSKEALRLRVTVPGLTWLPPLDASARNAASNGDFERCSRKGRPPDGWRRTTGSRQGWEVVDDPQRGKVLVIRPGELDALTIRQEVDLKPGVTYVLSYWARSENATPSVRVGVINAGWTRSQFTRPVSGMSGWHRITRRISPRESTLHQIVIWSRAGGGTVWIDDIRLLEGDDPVVEFPDARPELSVADWQELRIGSVVADPLIPLNPAGRLDVPPGESRQIWLTLPARDLPPGRYETNLQLRPLATRAHNGSPPAKSVRLQVEVDPLRVETYPDFAVYNWDYARNEAYVRDLAAHKVTFFLVSTHMPKPDFDEQGNAIGEIDYSAYDRLLRLKMRYARETGGQLLFAYGIIRGFWRYANGRKGWDFLSEPWVRAFRHTYTKWLEHLKALGLDYDDFCVQIWDEATGENVDYVVEGGKLLRKIDPKVRFVMDGAQSVEEVRRMDPYIDVWVPHLHTLKRPKVGAKLLDVYRSLGEPVYTYTCSTNMKSLSPYTYHRLKPWEAANLRLDGVFYWDYNSWRGDPWNDFDGPIADCGTVYDGAEGPITSRRWEASREGIEDWQILRLLEDLAAGDEARSRAARRLRDETIRKVLTNKDDRDLADASRITLIDAALALAKNDPLNIGDAKCEQVGRRLTVDFQTNRPATGLLLFRPKGAQRWDRSSVTQGAHTVRTTLPPMVGADWILLLWDELGRVATTMGSSEFSGDWSQARARGKVYADCGQHVRKLLRGWIQRKRDPKTHLYSRGKIWDYHNEAADHYSSLVLMASYVAPEFNAPGGTLHQTLVSSRELCGTPSGLPTLYDLKARKAGRIATLGELSEWLRDGLIRIVEVLGTDNIWYEEMSRLTDAMLVEAEKRGGLFRAFHGHEAWGNMLQTLARLYAMSADEKYLLAAEKLADRLLLDPENAVKRVRYQDHGCELTPGLAELFALESKLGRAKAKQYGKPLRRLLDRILDEAAHPETGLFCGKAPTGDGWRQPPDTWGYVLFAYDNYDRAAEGNHYRRAIEKPLRWLLTHRTGHAKYGKTLWPRSRSSDDWSDSYESMIVLWNRYPHVGDGFAWLDWATLQHIHRRQPEAEFGPYTGGHFDGSTGRTLCLHMMMCSQGVRHVPFQPNVRVGAVRSGEELLLTVESHAPYTGKLCFDGPRTTHRGATVDWARINEMPQWYVVQPRITYSVSIGPASPVAKRRLEGKALIDGLSIEVESSRPLRIRVRKHAGA